MTDSNSCLKRIWGYKSHIQTLGCVLGAEAGLLSIAKIFGASFHSYAVLLEGKEGKLES